MFDKTREKLTSVLTLRQWARLWTGSLVSFVGFVLLTVRTVELLGGDVLLPLTLGAIGAWCVWPVVIQEVFSPVSASDAEQIYREVTNDPDE